MKILEKMKKVPGGLLIVPMLFSAIINTIFPEAFQIGNPTTALFTSKGTMVLIGLMLFASGTQFKASQFTIMIKRVGFLCFAKLFIGYIVGIFVINSFGIGGFLGISAVAIIASITSCNPGLYLALVNDYGDEIDGAAFGILNLVVAPAIPLMIISSVSGQGVDVNTIIANLLPFFLGMLLGNLDIEFRKLYSSAVAILLPFMGISFGSSINLVVALKSGLSGILLTLIFYIVSLLPLFIIDKKIIKRPGYASVAMSSVAGLTISVPALVVEINPLYSTYVDVATAQIALLAILTSIVSPMIIKLLINKSNDDSTTVIKDLKV